MARLHLTLGTRYLWQSQVFVIRQLLEQDRFLVENLTFGGNQIVSRVELVAAWAAGELRFEVRGRNVTKETSHEIALGYTMSDFQSVPEKWRDEAWRRYQLLLPLLRLPPLMRTRAAIKEYAETLGPSGGGSGKRGALGTAGSWGSLERWLKAFVESGADIRALVPQGRSDAGQKRLDPDVEETIAAVLAECVKEPGIRTTQNVYNLIVNRLAQKKIPEELLPSEFTVYRRIQEAGAEAVLRPRRSRSKKQADAPTSAAPRPTRILERVEIDHTVLDLFLVDETDRFPIGRPTLTVALDKYSGFPLGIFVGFEPPSFRAVGNCLQHAILPKTGVQERYGTKHDWIAYGLPELLATDQGKDLGGGNDLRDACGQLGIVLEVMPAATPWYKGGIERMFRTYNQQLVHGIPGSVLPWVQRNDYDYDPAKTAVISLNAFFELLHVYLLDEYAQKPHKGIDGIPARLWEASVQSGFTPTLHHDATEVRILLARSDTRTIQRTGIHFESLIYQSPGLMRLYNLIPRGEAVKIKYDPGDLGAIFVHDASGNRWLSVPAQNAAYAKGLSLWNHRVVQEFRLTEKEKGNVFELAEAHARIKEITEREFRLTKSVRGRKKAARTLEIGTSPVPSTPPASPTREDAAPPRAVEPQPPAPPRTRPTAEPEAPPPNPDEWGGDYGLPRGKEQR